MPGIKQDQQFSLSLCLKMGMKWFSLGKRKKPKSSSSSSSPAASSSSSAPYSSSPRLSAAAALQVQHPADLLQLFDGFDADGDGRISTADLESLLRRLGAGGSPDPARDAASMLRAADLDGDGFISLEEFASVCGGGGGGVDEKRRAEELRGAFAVYDRNGDGVISAEELHQVLRGVLGEGAATLAECEGMIRAVDCNGDGAVSFDEFQWMMTRSSLAS